MYLHSVMAWEGLKSYMKYLPLALAVVCAVLLFFALCIGLKKGARQVSWRGVAWLIACAAFLVVKRFLHTKNPIYKFLTNRGVNESITDFASSFSLMLACVFAVLLCYGVCTLAFRRAPKVKERAKKERSFEMMLKYGSYEGVEIRGEGDEVHAVKTAKTSVFGRLMGGLCCLINTAMLLGSVLAVFLMVVHSTSLASGAFAGMYAYAWVGKLAQFVKKYAMDVAIVGVTLGVTLSGTKKGFTAVLRKILVFVGYVGGLICAVYLPFSRFTAKNELLGKIVDVCVLAVGKLGAKAKLAALGGKLLAVLAFALVVILFMLIFNMLMKKLVKAISRGGFFRVIDRMLAAIVYLTFAFVLCALALVLVYAMEHCGLSAFGGVFRIDGSLSGGVMQVFDVYLRPLLIRMGNATRALLGK